MTKNKLLSTALVIALWCAIHPAFGAATGGGAPASTQQFSNDVYEQSFKALFILFVVATILESGLAVIFNWRPFIQIFDGRGVRTVVSVAFAYMIVQIFDLDILTRLVNIYTAGNNPGSTASAFITALVIAGGSSGVNKVLIALGFRALKTPDQDTPRPPSTVAWLAVRLIRKNAIGSVTVLIGPTGSPLPVAGTITGSSSKNPFARFFLRDYGKFPTAGGHVVTPGATEYEVQLKGVDSAGTAITSAIWGPYPTAPGATVDIEMTL